MSRTERTLSTRITRISLMIVHGSAYVLSAQPVSAMRRKSSPRTARTTSSGYPRPRSAASNVSSFSGVTKSMGPHPV